MTTFQVQPQHSVGLTMDFETNSKLHEVPTRFAQNVGLVVVKQEEKKDPAGGDYIEFTIGTGMRFIAFDKKILD